MKPILSNIKLYDYASQETPCFHAKLLWRGKRYQVSNSGRGESNSYYPPLPHVAQLELNAWAAKNNPPITECGGCPINPPFAMDFETWTFTQAYALCAS